MDIKKSTIILLFSLISYPIFSQTCFYPGNGNNWSNAFVGSGLTNSGGISVKTVAMATGSKGVYVLFNSIATKKAGGLTFGQIVLLWNGKTWIPIGPASFPYTGSTQPKFIGMELVGDSALYIAGNFTTTSTLNSNGIIRLNLKTNQYESVGRGLGNGYAQKLKVFKDTLYMLGNFTRVRDANKTTVANYVARYFIGSNRWDSLGTGLGGFIPNIKDNIDFESLCQIDVAPNGEVFFAARFTSAGGISSTGIASWKTSRGWSGLYGGIKYFNGTTPVAGIGRTVVYSTKDTCLYIGGYVGYFLNPPGGKTGQFGWVRLRDTTWTKRVEGSTWNNDSIFNYNYPSFNSVTPYSSYYDMNDNKIYVGGDYQTFLPGDVKVFNINTQTFSKLNYGITNGSSITGLTKWNDTIFASGNNMTQVDSNIVVDNMAKFHSNKWHPLTKGISSLNPTKSINCIVKSDNDECFFGGEFYYANGKYFNGWGQIDSNNNLIPVNSGLIGSNRRVFTILPKNDTIFIGGIFTGTNTVASNSIIGYSKSNNSYFRFGSAGTGLISSKINKIEKFGNLIVVGGDFSAIGGYTISNLAVWNGSTWSSFGNPNGEVKFIQSVGDTLLYIAGDFTSVNGSTRNYIAKYSTTNGWQNVGSGLLGSVTSLSVNAINGDIWIGYNGSIPQISGPNFNAQSYAVFTNNRWKDFGTILHFSGFFSVPIRIYHTEDGTTYLTGEFKGINNRTTSNVIRYNPDYGWAGLGHSIITQKQFDNISVNAVTLYKKKLLIGGAFEGLSSGQASYCLASYLLDNPLDNVITVDLGKDTNAYYGYSLKANISGKYDSLIWSNGTKNAEYSNIYSSNNYIITAFNNGCEDKDTAYITINGKNIYIGGKGDGFSSNLINQNGKMAGGIGEGFSSHSFKQNGKMAGGDGDGFSSHSFKQNGKMAGGNGDGFSSHYFKQYGKMAGGNGDGFGNRLVKNNKTIYKGGRGDGNSMVTYLALPDGTIRKIISPLTYIDKDSIELSTWVHNIGAYPIYGFKVNWFVGGSLYTSEMFATDSIMPNDSLAVKAKKYLQWQKEKLPLDICVLVNNINKEQDTSNNQMCYIIDKATSIASIHKSNFDIKLYPNPSQGISNLEIISNNILKSNFKLLDGQGKIVFEKQIDSDTNKTALDFSHINSGIYYFVFIQGENKITGKIAVIH